MATNSCHTKSVALMIVALIAMMIMVATATTSNDDTDLLHILPITVGATTATIIGNVNCPLGCKGGDRLKIDFAPGGEASFEIPSATITIINVDGAVPLEPFKITPDNSTPTVISFEIPAKLAQTSKIQYSIEYEFKTIKKEKKIVPIFPLHFSSTVESTYSFKPATETKDWPSRITNAKFTVTAKELTASKDFVTLDLYDPSGGAYPHKLSIVIEDNQIPNVNTVYFALYGQMELYEVADLSQSSFTVNGIDVTKFASLSRSAITSPFADPIPTIAIDVGAAFTEHKFANATIPIDTNFQIQAHFGLSVLPPHDTPLKSYITVAVRGTAWHQKQEKSEVVYGVLNSELKPFSVKGYTLPTLTSTITADGNFLYQMVTIQYPVPTSIKDVKYSIAARRAKPQFSYIFLHNTTAIGEEGMLHSTLQNEKIWYNNHSLRSSVHSFQPMFKSSEFVSTTYSVLIVSPAKAGNGAIAQFNLHLDYSTETTPPTTITRKLTSIVSVANALPTMTTYPQFDVQLQQKKKDKVTEDSTSAFSLLSAVEDAAFSILVDPNLTPEERAYTASRNIEGALKFVVDFREIAEITSATMTFLNHQYVFVGDFSTGCTLDKKPVDNVITTPLPSHNDKFTQLEIKAGVKDGGHFYFTCKNGFIKHRETYQTDDILDAYFPLHVVGYNNSVPKTASGVMFHYPHGSLSADITFIIACVIIGIVIVPVSQLFLCWVHPTKPTASLDADESLINTGLLAAEEDDDEDSSILPQDRFTRPMHSVHRRLNLATQSEDPHH